MKKLNKLMAALLALVMCLSLMPMAAFAEDVPENRYQQEIDKAEDVKENADEAKEDSNISWDGVDQWLEKADGKNDLAEGKSDQVQDAVKKAEEEVAEVVEEQQGLVNAAEKTASGDINGAATEINGETKKVTDAVKEATDALTGVQEKLDALKDAELTPEEKVAAAEEAQTAADAAVKVAEDAAKVVETAQATVDAAVTKAEEAKAAYDAAVLAAQGKVGKAKDAALAELEEAKETLEAAKADLADATTAKETAERAKKNADGALKTAQDMLKAAQEAYKGIEWPEDAGIEKGSVTEEQIRDKNAEAMTASGEASQATSEAKRLGNEIVEHENESTEKSDQVGAKASEKSTAEREADGLRNDVKDLNTKKEHLTDAKTEYNTTVARVETTYNTAIDAAKDMFLDKVAEKGTVNDANGSWAENGAALYLGNGNYGPTLEYKGTPIKNNEFAYYLEVSKVMDGESSQIYQDLLENYTQWVEDTKPNEGNANGKQDFYDLLKACEEVAKNNVETMVKPAVKNYKDGMIDAVNTLERETACKTVTDVDGKITKVDESITEKNIEINKLKVKIDGLTQEINTLTSRIEELVNLINTKNDEKSRQEGIARDKNAEAEAAREAAQKLTDLLALQDAMEAAEAALAAAQEAQNKAAERQAAAQEKLDAYTDAQEAVKAAEEALKAKLSGDLKNGDLSLNAGANFDEDLAKLAAKLKEAQDAAKKAEEDYNAAKNDADQAKKDADKAKEDADKAKEDADRELADFNNRYTGDDTGDTGTTIDDTLIPLASGPVTRAQFVDYLWRHEGSPAAESELFADHEYAPAIAWALSVEIIGEDFQPDELVTVADVRTILGSFAQVFGTNAVDVADLTTLTGADDEAVLNCDQVLAEFFGEEYVVPEDLDSLETDTAA